MNNFPAACGLSWLLCVWRLWHSFWDIICSYHQGLRAAPLSSFLLFPIKEAVFHLSLGVEDCFSLVVLLMQRRRPAQHISLIQKIFSSLRSSMHNSFQMSLVGGCWILQRCVSPPPPPLTPRCVSVSTNWRSVHQRKGGKWKWADWKQALCCCCWDLFKMSCSTSSYVWHYFPDVTRLRVTLTRWSDVHASP